MKKNDNPTVKAVSRPGLPRRLHMFYGIGEFGQQFSLGTLNYFLLYFYTNVLKIDPVAAGVLMLVAKFWDGINDPIVGLFIDRSKPGKDGKCRPFLLRWAVPAGVFLWLLFYAPNLSPTLKLVYAYVTYFGQDLCYTATGLAYTTLQARIAAEPQDRVILNQSRAFISMFSAIFVSSATMGLVGAMGHGDEGKGFRIVIGIYAAILTLSYIFVYFLTKGYDKQDVATEEELAESAKTEQVPIKDAVVALFMNNLWRWYIIAGVLYSATSSVTSGLLIYYVSYYIGNRSLIGLAGLCSMVSGFLAVILLSLFTKKLGKNRTCVTGLCISLVCIIIRIVTGDHVIPLYLACLLVSGFGMTLYASLMVPNTMDCIEYGEWKTGVRNEALVMSAYSFGTKMGQGLGTSSIAFMLAAVGFDESLTVQTASCASGIHALGTIIPLVAYCGLIAVMLYINFRFEKHMPQIRAELAERRSAGN